MFYGGFSNPELRDVIFFNFSGNFPFFLISSGFDFQRFKIYI